MQQDGTDGPDRNKKRSGGGGVAGGGGGSSSRSSSSRSRGSSGGADGSKAGIARSGGGGSSGNGGGGGGAGAGTAGGGGDGSGERVTFEHEEIVTFEPWMADPDIAAVGRLEGITIEVSLFCRCTTLLLMKGIDFLNILRTALSCSSGVLSYHWLDVFVGFYAYLSLWDMISIIVPRPCSFVCM